MIRPIAAAALLLSAGAAFAARSASDWQFERSMEDRAESLLADVFGKGRARVIVRVQRRASAGREPAPKGLFDRVMQNIQDAPPVLPGYSLPRSLKDEILKAYAPAAPVVHEPSLAVSLVLDVSVPDDRVQPILDTLSGVLSLDPLRGDSVKVLRAELPPRSPAPPPSRTGLWAAGGAAVLLVPLALWAWRRRRRAAPAPEAPSAPRRRVDPIGLARLAARLSRGRRSAAPLSPDDLALFERLPGADPLSLRTCLCVYTGAELAAAFTGLPEEAFSSALSAFPDPVRESARESRRDSPPAAAERDSLRAEILARWRKLAAEGRVAPLALLLAALSCACAVPERRAEPPPPAVDLSRFDVGVQASPMSEKVAAPMGQSPSEEKPAPKAELAMENAPAEPDSAPSQPESLQRLTSLFDEISMGQGKSREKELTDDDSAGGVLARSAVSAYLQKENLKAVLLAQAALGDDPGSEARRVLLIVLARRTGIDFDPEGVLPLAGLVQHELRKAETAFFDQRFGAAVQASRRALLLDPRDARGWQRLGSAQYALGMESEARAAYLRALELDPKDPHLRRFMDEKGWK